MQSTAIGAARKCGVFAFMGRASRACSCKRVPVNAKTSGIARLSPMIAHGLERCGRRRRTNLGGSMSFATSCKGSGKRCGRRRRANLGGSMHKKRFFVQGLPSNHHFLHRFKVFVHGLTAGCHFLHKIEEFVHGTPPVTPHIQVRHYS